MSETGKCEEAKALYEELDGNMVNLVRVLNSFDGIQTTGICGGHHDPKAGKRPDGSWVTTFEVDRVRGGPVWEPVFSRDGCGISPHRHRFHAEGSVKRRSLGKLTLP